MENKNRFKKILENPEMYNVESGDEKIFDGNEPRNMLADSVNPLLEKYINPVINKGISKVNQTLDTDIPEVNPEIPKVSRADVKEYFNNFAANNAGMVGSIGKLGSLATQAKNAGEVASSLTQKAVPGKMAKSYDTLVAGLDSADLNPGLKQSLQIRAEKLKDFKNKYGEDSNLYLGLYDELHNTMTANQGYSRRKMK